MGPGFEPFRAAFEAIGTPVVVLSNDRVLASNEAARSSFGGEALAEGAVIEQLLSIDGGIAERAARARGGERERFEARTRDPAGDVRLFEATLVPLDPAAGALEALVLTLHDVTAYRQQAEEARHSADASGEGAEGGPVSAASRDAEARMRAEVKLKASEERLRSFIEQAPAFILMCDAEGTMLTVNRPPEGYRRDQIEGANVAAVTAPETLQGLLDAIKAAVTLGEVRYIESLGPGRAGPGTRWYEVAVGPLRDGGMVKEAILFVTDIDERKQLERSLAAAAERARSAAAEIEEKNRELRREIEERRAAEAALLQQQAALRALSTPIIQVWKDVLALPVVGVLDEARAMQLMERLLAEIVRTEAPHAILDLTGVERVDLETARYILDIAKAAQLLGSECLISGMSPELARTMVELDVDVRGIRTFGELDAALRAVIR
ncbi:PAS domain S-box protein [Polyangium aurulentum]|uniref:PAS domain S-box protein n=1 Tax=Polyangium aurulentum TaxID=2567896 RepID=UPI0010AE1FDA|nr:PAS domain S-box protein [Polyangium aurulentum]UQA61213.1 PAS domain S-box protein [Polyangium aurulentum]